MHRYANQGGTHSEISSAFDTPRFTPLIPRRITFTDTPYVEQVGEVSLCSPHRGMFRSLESIDTEGRLSVRTGVSETPPAPAVSDAGQGRGGALPANLPAGERSRAATEDTFRFSSDVMAIALSATVSIVCVYDFDPATSSKVTEKRTRFICEALEGLALQIRGEYLFDFESSTT
jgi:hypothetical protein